jgi:hypothetical protein
MYSSPGPLLLQAKEGGVEHFAPLCEAERESDCSGSFLKGVSSCDYIIDIKSLKNSLLLITDTHYNLKSFII